MLKRCLFLGLFSLLLLAGCKQGIVFSHTESIGTEGWSSDDYVSFEILVEDTVNVHSLDLHLRNDGRYAYSNLFLFIRTFAPTGASIVDTIECQLADKSGKWLGRGIGGQYQHTIPYKKDVVFPFKGMYIIEVEHGMRSNPLQQIKDLGLTIKVEK